MTAVEWLVEQIREYGIVNENCIEQAKEMESKQQKDMFIGGYTSHAMKDNKLPFGVEYLKKVADIEEEAAKLYDQHFK